jgi:hypothetical protein
MSNRALNLVATHWTRKSAQGGSHGPRIGRTRGAAPIRQGACRCLQVPTPHLFVESLPIGPTGHLLRREGETTTVRGGMTPW